MGERQNRIGHHLLLKLREIEQLLPRVTGADIEKKPLFRFPAHFRCRNFRRGKRDVFFPPRFLQRGVIGVTFGEPRAPRG